MNLRKRCVFIINKRTLSILILCLTKSFSYERKERRKKEIEDVTELALVEEENYIKVNIEWKTEY